MSYHSDYRSAQIEGREAFKAGVSLDDNPYTIEEASVRGWEAGWQDAADILAEREACAKIAEGWRTNAPSWEPQGGYIAAAIRARNGA